MSRSEIRNRMKSDEEEERKKQEVSNCVSPSFVEEDIFQEGRSLRKRFDIRLGDQGIKKVSKREDERRDGESGCRIWNTLFD